MTEVGLRELAEALRVANTDWVLVDSGGRIVDGVRPPGEDVNRWIPGWSAMAAGMPRKAVDGRWLQLEEIGSSADLSLYLVLDRSAQAAVSEVQMLAARRTAQAELAGATAREMNDAMTIVQGRLDLLRAFALSDPESAERHTAIAMEHAQRASETLHDLRLVGAVTPSDIEPIPLLPVAEAAVACLSTDGDGHRDPRVSERLAQLVQLDIHPVDLATLGQHAPLVRVLASTFRALGAGRDPMNVRARRESELVRIEITGQNRRRTELDALQLGIVTALVDALGGSLSFSGAGVVLQLPAADGRREEPVLRVDGDGELLVVGSAHLADRVRQLLSHDELPVRGIPTAEAAVPILEACKGRSREVGPAGLVTRLLLPEQSGIWLVRTAQRLCPDLRLRPLVVTPERVQSIPSDIRCLTGPLTRDRLVRGLLER